jgi:hypothetical protein
MEYAVCVLFCVTNERGLLSFEVSFYGYFGYVSRCESCVYLLTRLQNTRIECTTKCFFWDKTRPCLRVCSYENIEIIFDTDLDWVAHAILDSIVDSFYPLFGEVEKEIIAIDQTIFSNEGDVSQMGFSVDPINLSSDVSTEVEKPSMEKIVSVDEKISLAERVRESYHTRFASPRLSIRLAFRRFRRRVSFWKGFWTKAEARPSVTQLTLRRMARAKKLVTVLGRLLNAKSDVITGIKKRLVKAVESGGTGHKGQMPDELEVVIYMGDIQGQRYADYSYSSTFVDLRPTRPYFDFATILGTHRTSAQPITLGLYVAVALWIGADQGRN